MIPISLLFPMPHVAMKPSIESMDYECVVEFDLNKPFLMLFMRDLEI
jgi:hypothetical protein